MSRGRRANRNFRGVVPSIFPTVNRSHKRTWLAFKNQRNVVGPLTSAVLEQYAAFLLARFKFVSTNNYLASVVNMEGSGVVEVLFERNYRSLRTRVSRYLARE